MIWDWVERERKKRIKIINQGVLSASEQRAMKLKAAEQAGIEDLLKAQREEAEILAEARASVSVPITPLDAEAGADLIAEYSDFRRLLPNRKRGSIIRWKLAKLKEEKAKLVKNQGRRNKIMVLRNKKDTVRYAALVYQIGQLEKQYESLYPPCWHQWDAMANGGYWEDPWIAKRPDKQAYTVPWEYRYSDAEENEETAIDKIRRMAVHLKNVRADIRALTPPADEQEELSQAA
jgi:hypothetical protein